MQLCMSARTGQQQLWQQHAARPVGSLPAPTLLRTHRRCNTCMAKGPRGKQQLGDSPSSQIPQQAPDLREKPSSAENRKEQLNSSLHVSPTLLETIRPQGNSSSAALAPQGDVALGAKILWKRVLKDLSSLPRAIALMAATFAFSALGTFIPQNKAFEYYVEKYPMEGSRVLGFLDYNLIFLADLDHIYTAWYFYLTLAWLAASLAACTSTRQWPAARVAQRWRFQSTPEAVVKMGSDGKGVAEVLPNARISDLGKELLGKGYQVFVQDKSLYAFKGLAGRLGPIGVHAALLLILAGTTYSGFGGYKGTVMIPEGEEFRVGDVIRPVSPIATLPAAANTLLHVNQFSIDYRPDGSVAQFYSDLSLIDPEQPPSIETLTTQSTESGNPGKSQSPEGSLQGPPSFGTAGRELLRKTISVNDPFRQGGVTMYQTDWSLSAIKIRVLGPTSSEPPSGTPSTSSSSSPESATPMQAFQQDAMQAPDTPSSSSSTSSSLTDDSNVITLPMASLEGKPGINGRLWGSYLPVAAPDMEQAQTGTAPRGVSILARDPQSVIFYDSKGQFVGVRRPGSKKPIEVEGVQLVAEKVVGATGLELKSDPGVPLVYTGFGALMVTTLVSYLSHSQVWALQEGGYLYVAGKSNRAKLGFAREMDEALEAVPEVQL